MVMEWGLEAIISGSGYVLPNSNPTATALGEILHAQEEEEGHRERDKT